MGKLSTENEVQQWQDIANKAETEITNKYDPQTKAIKEKLELKGKESISAEEKKKLKAELKQLEDTIINEIKAKIKVAFNYQIPIAEVEKAGISTTGAQIENELEPLAVEFKKYREQNKLWSADTKEVKCQILDEQIGRVRLVDGIASEPEVFYDINK